MSGELLTVSDVASVLYGERTEASYKRALRLVKAGHIASIRAGTNLFVSRTALSVFLGQPVDRPGSDDQQERGVVGAGISRSDA